MKILSVSCTNDKTIDSSFSAKIGEEGYFVSNSGTAHMNFGRSKLGGTSGKRFYGEGEGVSGVPGVYASQDPLVQQQRTTMFPQQVFVPGADGGSGAFLDVFDVNGHPIFVSSANPNSTDFVDVFDESGQPVYICGKDPAKYRQPSDSFYSHLEAVITSSSAKTLAQPTLLIQEGQRPEVKTGESIVTGVEELERENGTTVTVPTRENAGLKVNVDVARVDDNGFVSLSINPEVSVAVPTGDNSQDYSIFNTSSRKLNPGKFAFEMASYWC